MNELQTVFDCEHPVALVTGSGAPRVGRAIVQRLARLGCHVALHANESVDAASEVAASISRDLNVESMVTAGSLEDESVPTRLVDETVERFGRIDILVNSAAIWSPMKLADVTAAELRRYYDINTIGSFLCARASGQQMANQPRGGSIINIGDWATVRPYLDHAAYFPSKGAVHVMTRSLAVELSQWNRRIRVNCIQPGPVMLAADVTPEYRQKIANSTLTGDIGTAQHIAHAVSFLCENDFITGACLPVDGGRSIYAPDGLQVGMNTG